LFSGSGQRLVEENLLAELRDRAQRRDRWTGQYNRIRIGTRQVFHDGAHAGRCLRREGDRPCAECDSAENHGGNASEQDVSRARETWLLASGRRYRGYDGVRHVNQEAEAALKKRRRPIARRRRDKNIHARIGDPTRTFRHLSDRGNRCDRRTQVRIDEQRRVVTRTAEVEHAVDAAGSCVERTTTETRTVEPVVFNEANH